MTQTTTSTNVNLANNAKTYLRVLISDAAHAVDLSYAEYRALPDVSEYDFGNAVPTFEVASSGYDMQLRIPIQQQGRYVRFYLLTGSSFLRIAESSTQVGEN